MRFLFEQRMLSASEGFALGLVSEVTDSDEGFEARILEYGGMLASVAPIAARQTKRMLVQIDQPPDLGAHLDREIELALARTCIRDSAEAIRAMYTKERPEFTGE